VRVTMGTAQKEKRRESELVDFCVVGRNTRPETPSANLRLLAAGLGACARGLWDPHNKMAPVA
jgi:hypothetical protein